LETHEDHVQMSDVAGVKMPHAHGSHDRHAGHSVAMFRDKFWLSFALTIPVVFWSTDVQHWLGYTAPSFPSSKFISAILGTVVFVYGGLVFIRGAWGELADHKPGMMTFSCVGRKFDYESTGSIRRGLLRNTGSPLARVCVSMKLA
jgi:Cu2+-exporting ATPase